MLPLDHGSIRVHEWAILGGRVWSGDDARSQLWRSELPRAGVYPSAHEPDDCDGVNAPDGGVDAPDAAVLVTGSDGTTVTMLINPAGNFLTTFGLSPPFTAKVVNGNGVLAMTDAVAVGDCNSCHTASGTNGAPGRIMLP
jgi:hypothetical protein